jgi:hypothetical protein
MIDGIDLQIYPLVEWENDSKRCLVFQVKVNKTFTFGRIIIKGSWRGKQFATLEENCAKLWMGKEDSLAI